MGTTGLRIALAIACVTALAGASSAHADTLCNAVFGGQWEAQDDNCTTFIRSQREAVLALKVVVPQYLVGHPHMGPPIVEYLRDRVLSWRTAGSSMVRASDVSIDYSAHSHRALRSVVFRETQQTVGNNANNAVRSFVFDLGTGNQLSLADLFKPGIDPLTALPPLARPFLEESLATARPPHVVGAYPFIVDRFEPQVDGSGYSENYRAFALTSSELILCMPDRPMSRENPMPHNQLVWSMDGGAVQTHIPLEALSSILRQDLTI